jgi:AcrR family transcriptional regulator
VVDVAAAVFVELGFQRAQMDDVADRLGVSKGTLYRSVDSKDALLAAVLAFGDRPSDLDSGYVIEVGSLSETADRLAGQLATSIGSLELSGVAVGEVAVAVSALEIAGQVERMALELFRVMSRHRVLIMVLDRCAAEVAELGWWFGAGRYAVVDLWEHYLERAADSGEVVDHVVLARTIVELITLWAVKMPWDPSPRSYPPDPGPLCARMVVDLVTAGGRT